MSATFDIGLSGSWLVGDPLLDLVNSPVFACYFVEYTKNLFSFLFDLLIKPVVSLYCYIEFGLNKRIVTMYLFIFHLNLLRGSYSELHPLTILGLVAFCVSGIDISACLTFVPNRKLKVRNLKGT